MVVFFAITMVVASSCERMFLFEVGKLRVISNGQGFAIPECAFNSSSTRPSNLDFSSHVVVNNTYWGYTGQACYLVNAGSAAQVVETRTWDAGHYSKERFYARVYSDAFIVWVVIGFGFVLLFRIRCVHAGVAVGIPGAALWLVYIRTYPTPIGNSLVQFSPAMLVLFFVSWKLERRDRELYVERRKVEGMLAEKDADIRVKSRTIEQTETTVLQQRIEINHTEARMARYESKNSEYKSRLRRAKQRLGSPVCS